MKKHHEKHHNQFTKGISIKAVYILGIILFIQAHFSNADNGEVQWEYSPKCESDDPQKKYNIPKDIKECLVMHMDTVTTINLTISNVNFTDLGADAKIRIASEEDILIVYKEIPARDFVDNKWSGSINAEAIFIGHSNVLVKIIGKTAEDSVKNSKLHTIIVRPERIIDKLFIISVASLVSILYINFGAALDLKKVKGVFRMPIGPLIAFCCHFVFLPLASYGLGLLLFPGDAAMQLGLFFTGASPAGGASNTWTVLLGGNLDLSITMSTTSTLAAFAMTPLWIFTLGKTIFDSGDMKVPYGQIASSVYGLIIPLAIGLLIQRYLPRLSRFLVRILKVCSSILILFIVVFAIITNLYLFKLFTWQIVVAGLLLPWLGYFIGWLSALICRQEYEDRLAIAVEAGIQNTGIAIFVLRSALLQPEADLTTIMPVSVAIMTPFPLMAFWLCLKCREWIRRRRSREFPSEIKECIQSQESGVY